MAGRIRFEPKHKILIILIFYTYTVYLFHFIKPCSCFEAKFSECVLSHPHTHPHKRNVTFTSNAPAPASWKGHHTLMSRQQSSAPTVSIWEWASYPTCPDNRNNRTPGRGIIPQTSRSQLRNTDVSNSN